MSGIVLTLPYPISANRYWESRAVKLKTGKWAAVTYVSDEAEEYRKVVKQIARDAGVQLIDGRVAVDIRLYPPRPLDWKKRMGKDPLAWDDDVRCMNLDNARKVLTDALNGVAYSDDKMIFADSGKRMEPDEGPARAVVRIVELALAEHPQESLFEDLPLPPPPARLPALPQHAKARPAAGEDDDPFGPAAPRPARARKPKPAPVSTVESVTADVKRAVGVARAMQDAFIKGGMPDSDAWKADERRMDDIARMFSDMPNDL